MRRVLTLDFGTMRNDPIKLLFEKSLNALILLNIICHSNDYYLNIMFDFWFVMAYRRNQWPDLIFKCDFSRFISLYLCSL